MYFLFVDLDEWLVIGLYVRWIALEFKLSIKFVICFVIFLDYERIEQTDHKDLKSW